MTKYCWILPCVACVALLVACQKEASSPATARSGGVSADGSKYLLSSEPKDAANVIAARKDIKDGDVVSLVGRIGGSTQPWIDGQAAFTIVDTSLRACNDIPGDNCSTPWDYCCEADLPAATVLVKIVNEQDAVVKVDARKLLKLAELDTVVVSGKAKRDESGKLAILASGLFVRR